MTPYGYQMGYPQMQNNPYIQQNYSPYGQNYNLNQNTNNYNEVIAGSIVDSEDVVRSKNCSLDGSATYYPLSDSSAIYVKKLNPQTGAGMLYKYNLVMPESELKVTTEEQVANILSSFKEEISAEFEELKQLVIEKTQPQIIESVVEKPVDSMTYMNRPRNGGVVNV